MILTLLLIKAFLKENLKLNGAFKIIKWIIIMYSIVNLISFLIGIFVFPDKSAFLNRINGSYYFTYWIMLFSALVIPFSLLFKKAGEKPIVLLFISILMKIGWYFERYVLLMASYHRDFWTETETDWFNSPWSGFYLIWIQGVILALILVGITILTERHKRKQDNYNNKV